MRHRLGENIDKKGSPNIQITITKLCGITRFATTRPSEKKYVVIMNYKSILLV